MTEDLQASIDNLYIAFEKEPHPANIHACACCLSEDELQVLISKNLRELSPDELTTYASCALLTVGSASDFRYFLPRILEICVQDPDWWPSPEVIAHKIAQAGWESLAHHQKAGLLNLLESVFEAALATDDPGDELDTWLCAAAAFAPDLNRYLSAIEGHPEALRSLFEWNSECVAMGKLKNSFWDDRDPSTLQLVIDWFNGDRVRTILNQAYSQN